ncbi:MAG: hypothetical protein ACKV2Q_13535 [Planctomycetaceae bacterium]
MGEIIDAFKAKAKAGHEGAARFLIDHVLGAKYTPTAVTVNHFHGDDEKETHVVFGDEATDETPLSRVSIYLSTAGQATPKLIAAETGISETEVVRVLDDHPERFYVSGAKYTLAK